MSCRFVTMSAVYRPVTHTCDLMWSNPEDLSFIYKPGGRDQWDITFSSNRVGMIKFKQFCIKYSSQSVGNTFEWSWRLGVSDAKYIFLNKRLQHCQVSSVLFHLICIKWNLLQEYLLISDPQAIVSGSLLRSRSDSLMVKNCLTMHQGTKEIRLEVCIYEALRD